MDNSFLEYSSKLKFNREVFLMNYSTELNVFQDTLNKFESLRYFISKERDINGKTHVSLNIFLLIIDRQACNAFNLFSNYQLYDAWVVFRPALESLLLIGKFLDNPSLVDIWKNRKELIKRQNDDKERKIYFKELEKKGLISSITYSKEFRNTLTKINDLFMHMNYEYFHINHDITFIDEKKLYFSVPYCDDFETHKAHLFSFLHLFRTMIVSLDKAFSLKYEKNTITDIEIESVENLFIPKIKELMKEKNDIFKTFGLFWK